MLEKNRSRLLTAFTGAVALFAGTAQACEPTESLPIMIARTLPAVFDIYTSTGSGAGFLARSDGYIFTVDHVASSKKTPVYIKISRAMIKAEVIGSDPKSDVSVLRVAPETVAHIPPLTIQTADPLLGEETIMIGSPRLFSGSISRGIVSAVHRHLDFGNDKADAVTDLIQTDGSINHGNSGGPALNRCGEVIGLAEAIVSPDSNSFSGLGFILAGSMLKRASDEIIAHGKVTPVAAGFEYSTPSFEAKTGRNWKPQAFFGARVTKISASSTDRLNLLRIGDKITGFDGKPVDTADDLGSFIYASHPGEKHTLTVERGKKRRKLWMSSSR